MSYNNQAFEERGNPTNTIERECIFCHEKFRCRAFQHKRDWCFEFECGNKKLQTIREEKNTKAREKAREKARLLRARKV